MSASIAAARRRALTSRMADSQLDLLLVYGNAWQSDYLRYVTDYGILEGEALALISRDGEVTLVSRQRRWKPSGRAAKPRTSKRSIRPACWMR